MSQRPASLPNVELVPETTSVTREEALWKLAALLASATPHREREIFAALCDREEQGSTALETRVAFPHATMNGLADMTMALLVVPSGVEFDAEVKPVSLLFGLISPPEKQVDMLRRVVRLARSFEGRAAREKLLDAATAEEAAMLLNDEEDR